MDILKGKEYWCCVAGLVEKRYEVMKLECVHFLKPNFPVFYHQKYTKEITLNVSDVFENKGLATIEAIKRNQLLQDMLKNYNIELFENSKPSDFSVDVVYCCFPTEMIKCKVNCKRDVLNNFKLNEDGKSYNCWCYKE